MFVCVYYLCNSVHDSALAEREAFQLPAKDNRFDLQACNNIMRPRVYLSPTAMTRIVMDNRVLVLSADIRYLEAMKEILVHEEEFVAEYTSKRKNYEAGIKIFQDNIVRLRRQKAMQKELEERIERLNFLRETRLRHLRDEKKRLLDEMKSKQEEAIKEKEGKINISTQVTLVGLCGLKS